MLINQLQPFADILTHDKGLPIVSPSKSTVVPIVLPDVRHRDIMITHADGQVGRLVVIRASASGTFALKSTFTKLGIESKSGLDFRVIFATTRGSSKFCGAANTIPTGISNQAPDLPNCTFLLLKQAARRLTG